MRKNLSIFSFFFAEEKYSFCWLNSLSEMTWTFVGPALVVVTVNLVILCKVVVVCLFETNLLCNKRTNLI